MNEIKPIETNYNGYRFRSRSEARWAVFFDVLGVPYQYEPQGFDLGEGSWYLPDFWLPQQECWVEVKGTEPSHEEKLKAQLLSTGLDANVVILGGEIGVSLTEEVIGPGEYNLVMADWKYVGVLFVGNHRSLSNHRSGISQIGGSEFFRSFEEFLCMCYESNPSRFSKPVPAFDGSEQSIRGLIEWEKERYRVEHGKESPAWQYGHTISPVVWCEMDGVIELTLRGSLPEREQITPRLLSAYAAARQARFEHGEQPKVDVPEVTFRRDGVVGTKELLDTIARKSQAILDNTLAEEDLLETFYNGHRFRARLEARWAIFYDTLDVPYHYGPEEFDLPEELRYVPDFWLPEQKCWIKIEPVDLSYSDYSKYERLATETARPIYIFFGPIPRPDLLPFDESARVIWGEDVCDMSHIWCECPQCGRLGIQYEGRYGRFCREHAPDDRAQNYDSPRLVAAYMAALQAQFETSERL